MTLFRPNDEPPRGAATRPEAAQAGHAAQGERRIVTVLFCDVAGSTAMAERLDPEEWTEVMNEAFELLIAPIHRYEGTVTRLLGDAILAFFGAPLSHEDDPQRAVLAGLQIIEDLRPFRERLRVEQQLDFNVRIGINTGPVVAGDVGPALASEYTAMGDAVNVAARMEQTAQPGTVQIAGSTHRLIEPVFDFESLGAIEVKGKAEPVPAYRVLGRKAAPGRLRGIPGLSAPLIGRASEMEKLQAVISGVIQGRGQIVCLIGEAGLGKSRILEELRARWETETGGQAPWLESRGISYDATRPYSLFRQRARQMMGIEDDDPPDVMRQKIAISLQLQNLTPEEIALCTPTAETLMAVREVSDKPQLPPEVLKRVLFDNVLSAWRQMASRTPTAMVFDDLHWADLASVELLIHCFQLVEETSLLLILAFRPERQSPAWLVKQRAEAEYPHRYVEVELKALSSQDTDALVSSLLTIADLPPALRQLILQKTEGNPFFVEEVVRTLIDAGAVVRDETGMHWRSTTRVEDISIPDNLQALLMARIDRLEVEARRTLQLASVIGRSFYHRVLKVISNTTVALDRQLSTLQRVELIREAARVPELEYMFRHELTRDAAYNTILRRRRREFHRHVGEAIEALFPDRLEDEAHRLAHHFHEAGDGERALKYYTLAGDSAAKLNANTEAIAHYSHALEGATAATDQQLIHLYTRLGRAYELSGQYEEALANYQGLETLGNQRNSPALKLGALVPQATIRSTYTVKFDPDLGQALSQQALALARQLGDQRAEAKALWNLMLLEVFARRNPQQAVGYGEQALALARQNNLQEDLPYILNDLARAYSRLNRKGLALEAIGEARELWRAQGNLPMVADSLGAAAAIHAEAGEFDRAEPLAREALRLSQSIGSLWGQADGLIPLGGIALERGDPEEAIKAWEEALPLAEQANFAAGSVFIRAMLALAYGGLGDLDRGISLARSVLAKPGDMGGYRWAALVILAHLQQLKGDVASAEAAMAEAQEGPQDALGHMAALAFMYLLAGEFALARHPDKSRARDKSGLAIADRVLGSMQATGTRLYLPDALAFKARVMLALGRPEEAHKALVEARAEAEAQGARRALWPVLYDLSRLEAQQDNAAEAARLLGQARDIVASIADHAGTPELRASFLASPPIRAVLEASNP